MLYSTRETRSSFKLQTIVGIRYKCLECPDFDFCAECHLTKRTAHYHRFVPVYDILPTATTLKPRHVGIYCDGPLCTGRRNQSYIQGIRYKCAVCHDVDFCASCEAHPSNGHNKTHPLIKFTTMVRDVSVETLSSQPNGTVESFGDRRQSVIPHKNSTTTLPQYTPQPVSSEAPPRYSSEKAAVPVDPPATGSESVPATAPQSPAPAAPTAELKAEFILDTVPDGTNLQIGQVFQQTWTLRNHGPNAWPVGCSVRHVGGDHMLNMDETRAGSVADLVLAQETNSTEVTVLPGQTFHFSVTLKVPSRPGKHISYWRLKTPDGIPFGHKLWCDIQAVPVPPQASSETSRNGPQPFSWQLPLKPKMEDEASYKQQKQMVLQEMNRFRLQAIKKAHGASFLAMRSGDLNPPKPEEESFREPAPSPKQNLEGSGMVFPKLEKESPASSAHLDEESSAHAAEAAASPSATTTTTESVRVADEEREVESVASFSDDEDDDDDGFLTDEEYDILDASDGEVINAPAS